MYCNCSHVTVSSALFFFRIYEKNQFINHVHSQGKTNQFGKREYSAFTRNKDIRICAVSAVALYFFSRWMVEKEPFPDFSNNASWFSVKAFKAKLGDPISPMNYQTHLSFVNQVINFFLLCFYLSQVQIRLLNT